jgi:predicted deacylase
MDRHGTTLTIADLRAEPGERAFGMVSIDLGPAAVELPIVLANGAFAGPRVGVTAGIHGAEYVSIAALRRVAMSLDPATMTGGLVAVLIANPAAYAARSIYVDPLDGKNLNRSFPGDAGGGPTERLAAWLHANVIAPADRFIDCHCGDMNEALVSFVGMERTGLSTVDTVTEAMAIAYGLDHIVVGPLPGSTTTAAASLGIPAVLGEVGGQGRWPDEDVALHEAGLRRALMAAGLVAVAPDEPRRTPTWRERDVWLRSEATGCWLPAVACGDRVEAGQRLGEVQDAFGRTLQWVEAPMSGIVLFMVTSLAMNAGDPLLAIAD